jgi:hypothetical protein
MPFATAQTYQMICQGRLQRHEYVPRRGRQRTISRASAKPLSDSFSSRLSACRSAKPSDPFLGKSRRCHVSWSRLLGHRVESVRGEPGWGRVRGRIHISGSQQHHLTCDEQPVHTLGSPCPYGGRPASALPIRWNDMARENRRGTAHSGGVCETARSNLCRGVPPPPFFHDAPRPNGRPNRASTRYPICYRTG